MAEQSILGKLMRDFARTDARDSVVFSVKTGMHYHSITTLAAADQNLHLQKQIEIADSTKHEAGATNRYLLARETYQTVMTRMFGRTAFNPAALLELLRKPQLLDAEATLAYWDAVIGLGDAVDALHASRGTAEEFIDTLGGTAGQLAGSAIRGVSEGLGISAPMLLMGAGLLLVLVVMR